MADDKNIFLVADNVCSPIGDTTAENFAALQTYQSGIKEHNNALLSGQPVFASLFEADKFNRAGRFSKFEQLLVASIGEAVNQTDIPPAGKKTILIISTTKGNIGLVEHERNKTDFKQLVALSTSARLVAGHFGFTEKPIVISNACISGVLAIITAMRLLRAGVYENAVVAGADVISKFILSGFQSFQALSGGVCRPFDQSHDGLNLGEGAGTVILSSNQKYAGSLVVKGGSVSNDANHISGPSRTGNELAIAIANALQDARVNTDDIDFISAHGTATVYNDEMEAKALRLTGIDTVPVNSLKGYYGHTLGAAGLIETIISMESMRQGLFLGTPGFDKAPELYELNVKSAHRRLEAQNFIKTASGFGGCNAALVVGN
jgi:3-oxoacyl-[acyl-carrier-protein] synthase-1